LPKREQDKTSSIQMTSKSDVAVETTSSHPTISSVDSTSLKERKTDDRNGITLKKTLSLVIDTMSRRPGRMHLREGLPKKRRPGVMPWICQRWHHEVEERGTSSMTDTKAPRVKRKLPLDPESESWHKLPWRKFEQQVYRIQKRIFRAEQRGNVRAVHKLQKLLMKSRSARLIAVRRVTQENQGKKTAGIDGVKSVLP